MCSRFQTKWHTLNIYDNEQETVLDAGQAISQFELAVDRPTLEDRLTMEAPGRAEVCPLNRGSERAHGKHCEEANTLNDQSCIQSVPKSIAVIAPIHVSDVDAHNNLHHKYVPMSDDDHFNTPVCAAIAKTERIGEVLTDNDQPQYPPKMPAAYVYGFVGDCNVRTSMGADTNNEAEHPLISEAYYRQYLEPLGWLLTAPENEQRMCGAGKDTLTSLGNIKDLGFWFLKKKQNDGKYHAISDVTVIKGDFSCDILLSVSFLRALGTIINFYDEPANISFKKIPSLGKIKLGEEPMRSVATANSSTRVKQIRRVCAVSTILDAREDIIVPPNTTVEHPLYFAATIQKCEQDYTFELNDPFSPVIPGLLPANKDEAMLAATNASDDPIIIPRILEITAQVPPDSSLILEDEVPGWWHKAKPSWAKKKTDNSHEEDSFEREPNKSTPYQYSASLLSLSILTIATIFTSYEYPGHHNADVDVRVNQIEGLEDLNSTLRGHRKELREEAIAGYLEFPLMPIAEHTTIDYLGKININPDLSVFQQSQLAELVREYEELFTRDVDQFQTTDKVEHTIPTGDAKPIHLRPRKVSPEKDNVIKKEIEKMTEDQIIEPCLGSPWASPVVCVWQKNKWRFCIDYRALNAVTTRDIYPIPDQEEHLQFCKDKPFKTQLDAWSGYWQIPMAQEDKNKTAFITPHGIWRFNRMPFGLANAPATFQRFLNDSLSTNIKNEECRVYIDDIIVASTTFEEHLKQLRSVFESIRKAKVLLKAPKCNLGYDRVKHLGRIIEGSRISIDSDMISAVKEFPEPKTVKKVQEFLGLTGYSRRFIPNFAALAAPLYDMTKKGHPATFDTLTPPQRDAMEKIKEALTTAPAIALPNMNKPFTLDVDACAQGFGATLLQLDGEGSMQVCAYMSRTTTPTEKRWGHPNKLEAQAIVWAVDRLRPYLHSPFVLRTDARNLCWLMRQNLDSGMYARWVMKLSEFDFEVKHATIPAADALSRNAVDINDEGGLVALSHNAVVDVPIAENIAEIAEIEDENRDQLLSILVADADDSTALDNVPTVYVKLSSQAPAVTTDPSLEDIVQEQRKDPVLNRIIKELENGQMVKSKQGTYYIECNVLHHQQKGLTGIHEQLVIPMIFQKLFIRRVHRSPITGHLGFNRTLHAIQRQSFWPSIHADVKNFTDVCHECQKQKAQQHTRFGELFPITYKEVMDVISVDVVGPFAPMTKNGNSVIFTIIDNYSNYLWVIPAPDQTAATTAYILYETVFVKHGFPSQLLSDRGSNFTSEIVNEMMHTLRVKQTLTSAWHPKTNGKNERSHKLLLSQMRMFVNANKNDWDTYLDEFSMAYNMTPLDNLGDVTPYYLFHGRHPRLHNDVSFDKASFMDRAPNQRDDGYADRAISRLKKVHQDVEELRARERLKWITRRKNEMLPLTYNVGDYVLLHKVTTVKGTSKKLLDQFYGPYRIEALHKTADGTTSPNVFDIAHVRTGKCISGVAGTRFEKYRPGVEFLLEDYDGTKTDIPSNSANDALQKAQCDEYDVGDIVIISSGKRAIDWHAVEVLAVDDDEQVLLIQYYAGYTKNVKKRVLKPVYTDPTDDKEIYTKTPRIHFIPLTDSVSFGSVIQKPFKLTKDGRIPNDVLLRLVTDKRINAIYLRTMTTPIIRVNHIYDRPDVHVRPEVPVAYARPFDDEPFEDFVQLPHLGQVPNDQFLTDQILIFLNPNNQVPTGQMLIDQIAIGRELLELLSGHNDTDLDYRNPTAAQIAISRRVSELLNDQIPNDQIPYGQNTTNQQPRQRDQGAGVQGRHRRRRIVALMNCQSDIPRDGSDVDIALNYDSD